MKTLSGTSVDALPHSAILYRLGRAKLRLEIFVTALANSPLYAWHSDGSLVTGWPPSSPGAGAAYPALGEISLAHVGYEVFEGHDWNNGWLVARTGDGTPLPGWPLGSHNYVTSPGALADIDGDGFDEMFIGEQTGSMSVYLADGTWCREPGRCGDCPHIFAAPGLPAAPRTHSLRSGQATHSAR